VAYDPKEHPASRYSQDTAAAAQAEDDGELMPRLDKGGEIGEIGWHVSWE
tara:strand:+ start:212 stop:361 length:150 start_codon:yes stop_codon:yes gene_type:complete